jgi:uncharacterized protein (TIGR03118 family)
VKRKEISRKTLVILAGLFLTAVNLVAQTRAYQQTNLAGSDPGLAHHVTPELRNPWGIAFLPGQPFLIANTNSGRVIGHEADGSSLVLPSFNVVNTGGTGPGSPTAIVSDPNSFFGSNDAVQPFIVTTEDGGIFFWGPDSQGNRLLNATLAVDHATTGAVYTGLAILTPDCCSPFLGVVNFHEGAVETYTSRFDLLAAPGNFIDPELPAGYAPFNIQVIGRQVFVTYAVQDAAQHDPVFGAGKGLVDIFDLEGNFVERFAQGAPLNAPWGVTQASANFGPFSNAILVDNLGDGVINAFDPFTGDFEGQIHDASGIAFVIPGLHALAFRNDGFGNPNTLYFTAGINDGNAGLFGAISTGLPSTLVVLVPNTTTNTPDLITAIVVTDPQSNGEPTGTVDFSYDGTPLGSAPVVNGQAQLTATLSGVGAHAIEGRYSGDVTFLPSHSQTEVLVTGPATTTTLTVPTTAILSSPVTLRAATSSASGNPTGNVQFRDQSGVLGTVPLNGGVATLTISNLSAGPHTVVAVYSGDANFSGSISIVESITITAGDFQLGTSQNNVTIAPGQSARFTVTVTPSAGFSGTVNFSCQAPAGDVCTLDPPSVNTGAGPASTVVTVTIPVGAAGINGIGFLFMGLMLIGAGILRHSNITGRARGFKLAWAARILATAALLIPLAGCGGYSNRMQPAPHTSSIIVTARSGNISHNTTLSVTVR